MGSQIPPGRNVEYVTQHKELTSHEIADEAVGTGLELSPEILKGKESIIDVEENVSVPGVEGNTSVPGADQSLLEGDDTRDLIELKDPTDSKSGNMDMSFLTDQSTKMKAVPIVEKKKAGRPPGAKNKVYRSLGVEKGQKNSDKDAPIALRTQRSKRNVQECATVTKFWTSHTTPMIFG